MKICFVCDDLMLGGWTSLRDMMLRLAKNGVELFAVCLFGKGYNAELLESAGIRVFCLGLNKFNAPFKLIGLVMLLRKESPSIVHTNLHYSDIFGQLAAMLAGIPGRIIHVHSLDEKCRFEFKFLKKMILRKASAIICVSEKLRINFLKEFPDEDGKAEVLYNGLDIDGIREKSRSSALRKNDFGIPKDSLVVLTVAHFKWQKAHELIVQSAEMMRGQALSFVLVGHGPRKEEISSMIRRKELDSHFVMLGARTDVPELMKMADVFLLPSVSESFGIALLEAFACGVPSVSTKIGGIAELARDGQDALLVEPDAGQICAALERLARDPSLRKSLSVSASDRAAEFDIALIANRYLQICSEISKCAE